MAKEKNTNRQKNISRLLRDKKQLQKHKLKNFRRK